MKPSQLNSAKRKVNWTNDTIETLMPFPKTRNDNDTYNPLSHFRPVKCVKWARKLRRIGLRGPWLYYRLYIPSDNRTKMYFALVLFDKREFRDYNLADYYDGGLEASAANEELAIEIMAQSPCHVVLDVRSQISFEQELPYWYGLAILRLYLKSLKYIRDVKYDARKLDDGMNSHF